MPSISQLYQYNVNYNGSNYSFSPIQMNYASSITFTIYSSVNCVMSVQWISDIENETVLYTNQQNVIGGNTSVLTLPVISSYAIFNVYSFATNPVALFITEGFYFTSNYALSSTGATGLSITGPTGATGATGWAGYTGSTGATGPSISSSYGCMTINNGLSGISVFMNTTPTELRSLSTSWILTPNNSSNITMVSNGRLQYTGSKTKVFMISGAISTNTSNIYIVALYKNGLNDVTSGMTGALGIGSINAGYIGSFNYFVSLAQNDYISFFVRLNAGPGNAIL